MDYRRRQEEKHTHICFFTPVIADTPRPLPTPFTWPPCFVAPLTAGMSPPKPHLYLFTGRDYYHHHTPSHPKEACASSLKRRVPAFRTVHLVGHTGLKVVRCVSLAWLPA